MPPVAARVRARQRAGRGVGQPRLLRSGRGRRRVRLREALHGGLAGRAAGRRGHAVPGHDRDAAGRRERRRRARRHRIACIRAFVDPRAAAVPRDHRPGLARAAGGDGAQGARRRCATCGRRCAGPATPTASTRSCSPPTPRPSPSTWCRGRPGCPYSRADAAWGRTVAFPALSAALRGVAERTGVRFLDLSRATEGYEACTRPTADAGVAAPAHRRSRGRSCTAGSTRPACISPRSRSTPPPAAHAEMGRCLGEFVRSAARRAACVPGPTGSCGRRPRGTAGGLTGPRDWWSEHDQLARAGVEPLAAVLGDDDDVLDPGAPLARRGRPRAPR